jgi:hypothetical protein
MQKNPGQTTRAVPAPSFLTRLIQRAFPGLPRTIHSADKRPDKHRIAPRPRAYELEAIDPRLLLSGSVMQPAGTLSVQLDDGAGALLLVQQAANTVNVSIGGTNFGSFTGFSQVVITGSAQDDFITLQFDGSAWGAGLSILGGGGDDSLSFSGALLLGGNVLSAEAEDIQAQGTIGGAGSVSLTAVGDDDASVLVSGSIQATGAIVLSAQAGQAVALSDFTPYASTSLATVDVVGADTVLTGASVAVTALNTVQITAALTSALPAALSVTQTNTTRAALAGGASVVSGGATTLSAVDDSRITIALDSAGFLGFDFGALTAATTLARTTTATVDGAGTGAIDSVGPLTVEARNAGGISAAATAGLVGTVLNTGNDTASASVANTAIGSAANPVGSVAVRAVNAASFEATGKVSSNTLGGGTSASVTNGSVVAGGADGVLVSASDSLSAAAHSTPVALDVGALVADLDIGLAVARNIVHRATDAQVTGAALTATDGGIVIEATSDRALAALAESMAISGETLLPTFVSVGVAGLFSENRVRGDVRAGASGSVLDAGGDLRVEAADTSALDAKSELAAKADTSALTIFSTAGSAGVSIALNTLGWNTASVGAALGSDLLSALLGTDFGLNSEDPLDVQATVVGTDASVGGDLSVLATSAPQINATVSNAAESTASSLFGARGGAVGGILASNRLSGGALAVVDQGSVDAGGTLSVQAENLAGVYANAKVVSSAITTNDGGAEFARGVVAALVPDFDTDDGVVDVTDVDPLLPPATLFGIKVRVEDGYTNGGDEGRVYRYLGTAASLDLAAADYSDLDFWKEELATSLIPAGFNVSASNSVAAGGMVVFNDVRSSALAGISDAQVQAGDVRVDAVAQGVVQATADNSSVSSGGSSYNGGGTSVAANGTIATNNVTGGAEAWVEGSTLDVAGDVALQATNASAISANVQSAVSSAGEAVGVLLAFNAVGHQPTNLLFNALDALIALPLGAETPAQALVTVRNSAIDAGGAISLAAQNTSAITAIVGNEATSLSEAMFGASAMSATGVLASNKVSSRTRAEVVETAPAAGRALVAGDTLTLTADDSATIDAITSVGTSAKKNNDLGTGLLNSVVDSLLRDYRYTSLSGTQALQFGDLVRLGSNVADPTLVGRVAQYMGQGAPVDLGAEDYADFEHWKLLDDTNAVPKAVASALIKSFGLDNGGSEAFYGLVTRNEYEGTSPIQKRCRCTKIDVAEANLNGKGKS